MVNSVQPPEGQERGAGPDPSDRHRDGLSEADVIGLDLLLWEAELDPFDERLW
jgi:hypothetical protein